MPYAELNGFRMFYQQGRRGDALVFIHGGIASLARTLKDPDAYGRDEELGRIFPAPVCRASRSSVARS